VENHFKNFKLLKDNICMGKRMKREYEVIIEKDEDGYYHARVPELPGCFTQAESLREVNKNIKEAIDLYLEIINN
jgi:predicted RNase H-like HicB family nuclease